ncbi:MAG: hypothetical protein PHP66_00225 [Syntrophales bacterium]|nr:hypothetical protein [Syntrophales bacterium]
MKGDVEKRIGREGEDHKGGQCKAIPEIPFPVHQDGEEKNERHNRCAHDRDAGAGNQGIKDDNDHRKKGGYIFRVPPQKKIIRS